MSDTPSESSSKPQASGPLKFREKICFGLGDVSNGLAVSSISLWFLYYLTDVAGMQAMFAGIAVAIGRLWDALTDPIMGWITDHTKSRWGKRLPYLLFGAIPYALAYFALWTIPEFSSEYHTFMYVTVMLIVFNTFLTVVFVPYTSLTAAITKDYNERTSITGYRMVCSQIAFLIGASLLPTIVDAVSAESTEPSFWRSLSSFFGSWEGTARGGYAVAASLFGILIVISVWTTFFGTREREAVGKKKGEQAQTTTPFSYASHIVNEFFGNRPFLISVLILLFSNTAATLAGVNLPYYLEYVLGLEQERSKIIFVIFLTAIVSVPIWVTFAKRWGKAEVFRIAAILYAALFFAMPLFTPAYNQYIWGVAVLIGFFHAAALTIPWAIIPDVVEYDELKTGRRREGLFYGGTTFCYKAATGIAFLVSSFALELAGYQPNIEQGETAIWSIKMLIGPFPAAVLCLAFLLSFKYPLTAEKHQRILQELEKRRLAAKKL